MRKLRLILTLSLLPLFAAVNSGLRAQQAAQQQAAKRHRIAVLDFNDSAANSALQAAFGQRVDFGKGVAVLLIDRLMKDGTYRVIETNQIRKILADQNLLDGNSYDQETAAKIGHVLGVDAVVMGEVAQFGLDDQGSGKSELTAGKSRAGKSQGAATAHKIEVVVALTAQFVDTNTGQVLATASCKGVSQRTGTNVPGAGAASGGTGAVDMASSVFAQTMIGQATTAAVDELAKQLEAESERLPHWAPPPLRGQITDASTPNIVVNVGSTAGLKVGDKLLVTRVVHVVRERVANQAVGSVEDQVGVLTITRVEEGSAVGRFSGAVTPKAGDMVRPLQ